MAITITKGKTKTKAATNVIDAVVQRFVANKLALEAKLAKLAALQAEVEADEKELLSYADMLVAPEEATEFTADGYVIKVGPKGKKAVAFDKSLIKAELGPETFDEVATFQVGDLKKYLTGNTFDKAVTYAAVNKRRIVIEEVNPSP